MTEEAPADMRRSPHHVLAILALLLAGLTDMAIAELPPRTPLDDYIDKPDASYRWQIANETHRDGVRSFVIDMVSQIWLSSAEVDRPEWRHWLILSIPDGIATDVALLYIGGGRNGAEPPTAANQRMDAIARATGTVVAELRMVPNQPLMFHGDGMSRSEDDLIGYTWDQYLQTGNATWLARNPMVKSAVRAMDTVTAVMALPAQGSRPVTRFVVAGGSKRGWTTWLTGAVDRRVVAIVPIVIDVLNADVSMRHHFAAYGFWGVSIGNYVDHRIMTRLSDPRLADLYRVVDPYYYRHRLTMPKLIINAAGDQFFLPDSSRFYFAELRGESYLRYVPNADHSLDGTDATDSLIAFVTLIKEGRKPPQLSWTHSPDGTLLALPADKPTEVLLWQMTNPKARDFRVETSGRGYTSTPVVADVDGLYRVHVPVPSTGWTAYFLEFRYDVGAATPLKLTTDVTITPDTLPFADKAPDLAPSITWICTVGDSADAVRIAADSMQFFRDAPFASHGIESLAEANRVYLNWEPVGNIYEGRDALKNYLATKECQSIDYQLESGPGITLPPVGPVPR